MFEPSVVDTESKGVTEIVVLNAANCGIPSKRQGQVVFFFLFSRLNKQGTKGRTQTENRWPESLY